MRQIFDLPGRANQRKPSSRCRHKQAIPQRLNRASPVGKRLKLDNVYLYFIQVRRNQRTFRGRDRRADRPVPRPLRPARIQDQCRRDENGRQGQN